MYLKIHRGTTQIGGNIIEIGTENTHLIFDAGANLPLLDTRTCSDLIEIEGLTCGKAAYDAVFISHHHNDHCGLLDRILPSIPIWAGRETARILDVIADFTNEKSGCVTDFFTGGGNCPSTVIGDITVTPIGVDHSAYDAYMFLIQADGKNILYTGDYRVVEDVPDVVQRLIGVAGNLDVLITEGTNIRAVQRARGGTLNRTLRDERMVEEEASKLMEAHEGTIFLLCSSTNEARIRAIDAACQRVERIPCYDLFLTAVRDDLAKTDVCKAQPFVSSGVDEERTPRIYPYFRRYYGQRALVGVETLAKLPQKQVILIRTSMLKFIEKYLEIRNSKDDLLIYSMWEGYKDTEPVKQLLNFCAAHEIETVSLHCSGHAYQRGIKGLICRLKPTTLIPIHCDSADRTLFEQMHSNCVMLQDGKRLEV
ncbi:MBL fold metallo-hydrolase [Oscillospiraceae bacterium PP1C4]